MTDHSQNAGVTPPTRRSVLVAGTWSVPVILTAVGMPLAAASTTLEIEALSGDVSDRQITFPDVTVGDTTPLVFQVTQGASGYSGNATAMLVSATGIAEWDESVLLSKDHAAAAVDDGYLVLPLTVLGAGEFSVIVSVGGTSWTFSVTLITA